MSTHPQRVKRTYDEHWGAGVAGGFGGYERNRLLQSWMRGRDGRGLKMLDVGCGDGSVCDFFAGLGFEVAGIDLSEVGILRARERSKGTFKVANVEEPLPFDDAAFDLVFWGDNIEHLLSPLQTLGEIRRVLKRSGTIIISCPNVGFWWFRLIYVLRGAMPRNEGLEHPPWAWEHIRFFNPRILRSFLAAGGFRTVRLEGTWNQGVTDRLARLWPGMFATLIMVEAEPSEPDNQEKFHS